MQFIKTTASDHVLMTGISEKGCDTILHTYPAVIGAAGVGKRREGDGKTPLGTYWIQDAYGILDCPACGIPFHRIDAFMYWCTKSESPFYNRLVLEDAQQGAASVSGEHLLDYLPEYNYFIDIGYNVKGIPDRGSAVFLHCRNQETTQGCIAVEQDAMLDILRWLRPGAQMRISL